MSEMRLQKGKQLHVEFCYYNHVQDLNVERAMSNKPRFGLGLSVRPRLVFKLV